MSLDESLNSSSLMMTFQEFRILSTYSDMIESKDKCYEFHAAGHQHVPSLYYWKFYSSKELQFIKEGRY